MRKHCQIPWVLLYIERWLKAPLENEKGLLVAQLQPNGPAEKAGLHGPKVVRKTGILGGTRIDYGAADIVVAVDEEDVKSQSDFLSVVESKRPNDQVIVTVLREGRKVNVPVTLGGPNPEKPATFPPSPRSQSSRTMELPHAQFHLLR